VIRTAFCEAVAALTAWRDHPHGAFLNEMRLYLGAEHHLSSDFLEGLAARQVVPIHTSAYLLVELSPYLSFELLDVGIGRILQAGFFPLLAHVERYEIFRDRPQRLAAHIARGCVAQVNGNSVLTEGRRQRTAHDLLRRGLVHVIASDSHGSVRRPPNLRPASEELLRRFSREQVKAWMFDNPGRLLNNRPPVAVS
jgi:protein-tyrosine phosphatase